MNDRYPDLYSSFQWFVPSQFNIAQACVLRWAENLHEGRRAAIYYEDENGNAEIWNYTRLSETCNQLANGLIKMAVRPGDRVAVVMGQRPEFVASCMAVLSVGAIAVPLSARLGPDGLGVRLRDADARVAITDALSGPDVLQAQVRCPALTQIVGLDFQHDNILPWRSLLARQATSFKPLPTKANSAALLFYDTRTGAKPLGVVHTHRSLIGNLPGFVASQNWFPQSADIFWTPTDWTKCNGLLNALLPTLYFGRAIVATAACFSTTHTLEILERYRVTNTSLEPDAIRLIMGQAQAPRERYHLALRALTISGKSLPTDAFKWCQQALGVTPNETFSQTESNYVVGNSHLMWPAVPGSMGRPYPGHLVTVLDPSGKPCPANVVGEIAINRYDILGYPDPSLFESYWRNDTAAHARFHDDWLLTGDLATIDRKGYFWHCGQSTNPLARTGQYIEPADIMLAREQRQAGATTAHSGDNTSL
jgi:acetyl-CoA synthetase